MGPTVEEHAVTAQENPGFLYSLFTLGINIEPTALVPATPEPLIQPKIILTNTVTCATLPRILPTVIRAKFNIRSKIPEPPMSSPANIKNGMATKANKSIPLKIRCGIRSSNSGLIKIKTTIIATPKEKAIGTAHDKDVKNIKIRANPMKSHVNIKNKELCFL